MTSRTRAFALLSVLIFALAAWTSDLDAAPVITTASNGLTTPSNNTDELAYSAFVSTTDLLQGIVGTGGSWNASGSSPTGLNDGTHGGDSNVSVANALAGAAWAKDGNGVSFRDFVLGPGANGLGFDITEIQSIASWQGAGFQNQKYEVFLRTVGSSTFILLTTVNFQPSTSTGANTDQGGSTKVNVTDTTGILASGIDAIRFNVLDTVGNVAGGTVFREIDVFGTSSSVNATPLTVSTLSPVDNSGNVAASTNLVVSFNRNIAIGTGNITIKDLDTPSQTVITLPDAQVSVSGALLTINPTANLTSGKHYAIRIDAGAIKDLAGNSFAGITTDTTWDFTTGVPDLTPPAIVTLSPTDNATNVPIASNLVATFGESIVLGTGSITIKNLDTASQTVITLPDARVSVSGAVLTINPSSDLSPTTKYAVRIAAGSVTDLSGNPFGGIADDTTWNFTTASTPLRIMCLGDSITAGYTDNPNWTVDFKFGFRSGLYTRLTSASYNFLLVGGSGEPWNLAFGDPSRGGTYKPTLDLRDLGQDGHRGYGGKTASYLNSNILSWLASDNPDIILLKIGTNSQDQSGLNTLVNTITTTKPNAYLIIAQIMPKYTYQQGIVDYNSYIRNTLVPNYQALGKKVTLVDQYAPFLTNPAVLTSIDQSLFSNGINHPSNPGYDKMAQVWFAGIESLGLGPKTFANWISDPAFGIVPGQRGLDQDPDGDGIANGVENFFGTNPGSFSPGLVSGPVNTGTGTFTFTHPINNTPASDIAAVYKWSKDLAAFYSEGSAAGTTVAFSSSTAAGITTETATVTGTIPGKFFVRVIVTQN